MINKNSICAVVGKGGTGKTTISGLLIKYLLQQTEEPILAIDADPSACLGDVLGMKVKDTLGDIREDTKNNLDKIPAGMTKKEYLDFQVQSSIVESPKIDLLTMGRPEGPGCYCYVNNILRNCIDTLSQKYSFTVMDCEAGIEHLSRRTTVNVDYLFIVTDVSIKAIKTVQIILHLIEKLQTIARKKVLLINKWDRTIDDKNIKELLSYVQGGDFALIGKLPEDKAIIDFEMKGESLLDLPDDSPIFLSFKEIISTL